MVKILKGASLKVPQGKIMGIIGRSGTGKTTLLRCLNGLESPTSGEIFIQQQSLLSNSPKKRQEILQKIGTVFQGFNLLSRRTVLENIALPLEFMKVPLEIRIAKAQKMANLVGLSDKYLAYPSQLSGGQRQRVAIARALVADVHLLLCDEFTSALDPETSLEILSLLQDLNQRLGITIVLITHDMSVIREICDEVCVLDQGATIEEGSVESILLHPHHDITKSLVSHLFLKDLPKTIQSSLKEMPNPNNNVVLRLMFSDNTAFQPAIASIIQTFNVPINIVAGNLGHVKETTFGSLIITLPARGFPQDDPMLSQILDYFQNHHISAEILGFIPTS